LAVAATRICLEPSSSRINFSRRGLAEDTKLQDSERLSRLITLLALAFTRAFVVGLWEASVKELKLKKHGYPPNSIELEAVLLERPDIADCGVTGSPDAEAGESPKAFVVPRAGRMLDLNALARFVSERVAGYKQIRHFQVIESIPK